MGNVVMLYKHIKGGTVVFPRDWIDLELDDALDSPYVGVVEMHNGAKYNVPHFIFHSRIPINEISDETELSIFEKCCDISPEFLEGYRHDLRWVLDSDTKDFVDGEDSESMTISGIFSVEAEEDDDNHPYGAMILKCYL